MKKILSFLVIAFITITLIWNVAAMGSPFDSATLKIDWKIIWEWKQIRELKQVDSIYYFSVSEKDGSFWFYKVENLKLIKMSEDNYYKIETHYNIIVNVRIYIIILYYNIYYNSWHRDIKTNRH